MSKTADVIIIGGGIVGSEVAGKSQRCLDGVTEIVI